jgi:hypothetical protein
MDLSALFSHDHNNTTPFITNREAAYNTHILHHGLAVTHHITGKQMEYKDLIKDPPHYRDSWLLSKAHNIVRLAQGIGNRGQGTNTIFFVHKHQVPFGKTVAYTRTVCTVRPKRRKPTETNRKGITVRGNFIHDYPGCVSTEASDTDTVKLHWNSTLHTSHPMHDTSPWIFPTCTSTLPWTDLNT